MASPTSSRIVSRNLLISASRSLSDEAAQKNEVTVSNFRDLCTLIDISALYERVETVANADELDDKKKPYIGPEYERILKSTGLELVIGPSRSEFQQVVNESSAVAILPFAKAGKNVSLTQLQQSIGSSLRREISDQPDYWQQFAEGARLAISGESVAFDAARDFWYRSFLYVGLAKYRKTPFVPDAVRMWGIEDNYAPNTFTDQLQAAVNEKFPPGHVAQLLPDAPIPIPPFAATVFLRAGNDKSQIPEHIRQLREEMSEVRQLLNNLQLERDSGAYLSGIQTLFAPESDMQSKLVIDKRVHTALAAFQNMKVPLPRQFVKLRLLSDIIRSTISLFDHLVKGPLPDLWSAFKDGRELMSKIIDVRSSDDNYAFLEVHNRLGWDLRHFLNSGVELTSLFGHLRDDQPTRPNI